MRSIDGEAGKWSFGRLDEPLVHGTGQGLPVAPVRHLTEQDCCESLATNRLNDSGGRHRSFDDCAVDL
ncbi:MAG: hypothetical protein U1E12_07525 [Hydrogenophaga sp.]|uniref:hypothetical protein n=1 Tax=Hydrogenophaga sp. TaxID=1904254 RepID=UPI002ABC9BCE|nr:hypothetical protein [Hydrogenophaga sp.]MDZ4101510.1 hypothetical protein [Hydrogenophaga sp.]